MTRGQRFVLEMFVRNARPRSEEDWGSERQIEAENQAYKYAEMKGLDVADFETMRASTEEMLDELIRRADAATYGEDDEDRVYH